MKTNSEKWKGWVKVLALACRYAGIVVLTFTGTSVMYLINQFDRDVRWPLEEVADPDRTNDIENVSKTLAVVRWRLIQGVFVDALSGDLEGNRDLILWRSEVSEAAEFADNLMADVIRGRRPEEQVAVPPSDGAPFDAFYGSASVVGAELSKQSTNGRTEEDLGNHAMQQWHEGIKGRGYAFLRIPDRAALYPDQKIIRGFVWTGLGLLLVGLIPVMGGSLRSVEPGSSPRANE